MNKCQVAGTIVTPCKSLESLCEFGNPPKGKRKGVYCWQYHKPTQSGPTRQFFGAKSGEHSERGIAFNFCPFCGTDIAPQ